MTYVDENLTKFYDMIYKDLIIDVLDIGSIST